MLCSSYDLLEEEDSEEFETVEVSLIDDDIEGRSYLPMSGQRRAKEVCPTRTRREPYLCAVRSHVIFFHNLKNYISAFFFRLKKRVRKLRKLSARRKKLPAAEEVDISQVTVDERQRERGSLHRNGSFVYGRL